MAIIWVSSGQYCQWRLIIVIITNQREHLHNRLATTVSFNIDQELEVEDGFKMFKNVRGCTIRKIDNYFHYIIISYATLIQDYNNASVDPHGAS